MSDYDNILIVIAIHQLFENFNRLRDNCFDREIFEVLCLFGKPVAFEIKSNKGTEIFNLSGKSSKTEGRMTGSVNAEEQRALSTCSENRGSLNY